MAFNENKIVTSFLSSSDKFIETIVIKAIDAQPGLVELTVKTQLLTAKNPDDLQVKYRACIKQSRLEELGEAISRFLEKTHK
jgi:hypothetical protein